MRYAEIVRLSESPPATVTVSFAEEICALAGIVFCVSNLSSERRMYSASLLALVHRYGSVERFVLAQVPPRRTVSFDSVSWTVCASAGTAVAADSIRPALTRTTARRIIVRSIKSYPREVVDVNAGRLQRP